MKLRERSAVFEGTRSALLLGATGATGSRVLHELLERDNWARVVIIGRRALPDDTVLGAKDVEFIHLEALEDESKREEALSKLRGIDTFFNCIGTTRGIAGGAMQFHDIEVGVSKKVATLAVDAGIKCASVISAQNASPNRVFAPSWFHPLFYGKTMGLKETAMISAGFDRVTVFRPGILNRVGEGINRADSRPLENVFASFGLKVSLLAKAMVNDAEAVSPKGKEEPLYVSGNKAITEYSKL